MTKTGTSDTVVTGRQIDLRVVVTVGKLSSFKTRLAITKIATTTSGSDPDLCVHEHNPGQTFASTSGTVVCSKASKKFTYPIPPSDLLPGGGVASLVKAVGLPSGTTIHRSARLEGTTTARTPVAIHAHAVSIPKAQQQKSN